MGGTQVVLLVISEDVDGGSVVFGNGGGRE